MNNNKFKKKLFDPSINDDTESEEAKERQENAAWLKLSLDIAFTISKHLRSHRITQKKFAEKLGYTPEYAAKVLKGTENLTLENIAKIEKVLKVKLITVSSSYEEALMYNTLPTFHLIEAPVF